MRICMLYDRKSGGVPRLMHLLAASLQARGHALLLVGPIHAHPHMAERGLQAGVLFEELGLGGGIALPRTTVRSISQFAPDVVLSTHRGCDVRTARLTRRLGLPLVCILQGNPRSRWHVQHPAVALKWLRNRLWRRALLSARCVICISNYVADNLKDFARIPGEMVYVVPNAIVLEEFGACENRKPPAQSRPVELLASGRLSHEKRPELLLRLMGALKGLAVDAHARWLGSGPLLEEMRSLCAAMHLHDVIEFPGAVRSAREFYDRSDVFVHFCLDEGFGLVLAEAQASGLPVVAFDSGAVGEVVAHGETGILCKPDDVEELARAVAELRANAGKYVKLSRDAIRRARECFSPARMAEDYENVLLGAVQA